MDESIWFAVFILAAYLIGGVVEWHKDERHRRLMRQKVAGSTERHIDLRG